MTVLDILVPPRVWAFASVRTTSLGAEAACDAMLDPFTGAELMRSVFEMQGHTVPECLVGAAQLPVVDALGRRGAVVVNRAGRAGVVVGYMTVVQAAGRRWALAETSADWWVAGWWLPAVVGTLPIGGPVTIRRGLIPDPNNPGLYYTWPLRPDPANEGAYFTPPLLPDPEHEGAYLTEW